MIDGKSVRKKLIGSNDERAVSPVIGVILMVAITVILAAVIAAFVLDMGPGNQAISAAADIETNSSAINVSITSGGENLDGIAAVDSSGSIEVVKDGGVNTGGTYGLSVSGGDYTVYGYEGSLSSSDTIDDAEANVELGTAEV